MSYVATQSLTAIVPDLDDIRPGWRTDAAGTLRPILELVQLPLAFALAESATRAGRPGCDDLVALAEARLIAAYGTWTWTDRAKKFLGEATRAMMVASGQYETTGTKRVISHPSFSRGEVYRRRTPGQLDSP